jgi:hypothetical protein
MSLLDEVLTDAKRHHVSITYAAQMAGVHRRNIYNAKLHGRSDIDQMLPAERKHLIAIQRLCKEQEKENQRIKRHYGSKR